MDEVAQSSEGRILWCDPPLPSSEELLCCPMQGVLELPVRGAPPLPEGLPVGGWGAALGGFPLLLMAFVICISF